MIPIEKVFAKKTFFSTTHTKPLLFPAVHDKIGVRLLGKIDKKGGK